MTGNELSRRRVVQAAAAAGLVAPALAACGESSEAPSATPPATAPSPSPTTPTQTPTQTPTATPRVPGAIPTRDVPVGGGKVLTDKNVVVTQPTAGNFRAFTATCTHQGCQVASVSETINCPCHGSRYSIEDGSVANGPATRPLSEKSVTVTGDSLTIT